MCVKFIVVGGSSVVVVAVVGGDDDGCVTFGGTADVVLSGCANGSVVDWFNPASRQTAN